MSQESEIGPGPVAPGVGWPDDPADPRTPVARSAAGVRQLAGEADSVAEVCARMSVCRACPRLVEWRESVASERRRAYEGETYWGRPLPGWGAERPRIVVVGLAPAAHGGNRTGRIFTGDRSGDWLFGSLHRVGLAAIPTSTHAGDGQRLRDTRVVAAVRCAPPANKPTTGERDTCSAWLEREIELVAESVRAFVVLGGYAWTALWPVLRRLEYPLPERRPGFRHGVEVDIGSVVLIGSYHPSQQNTFTGKLTESMLDDVFVRAKRHAALD